MNFKSLILFAGAVALASASSFDEGHSNELAESQVEEESNEMAQTECHPGPKRCARCNTAGSKKNLRYKQIIAWRNAQNKANVRNYHAWNKYRMTKYN